MQIDLTHIIMTIREVHPEFSYEELEVLCNDFITSQKKVKKVPTMIKQLCGYMEKELDVDMSKIDYES